MSHFNHPCITTPACIPSPSHLALLFRFLPLAPTPCVTYIPLRTSATGRAPIPPLVLPLGLVSSLIFRLPLSPCYSITHPISCFPVSSTSSLAWPLLGVSIWVDHTETRFTLRVDYAFEGIRPHAFHARHYIFPLSDQIVSVSRVSTKRL